MIDRTPLADLILRRMKELGLDHASLGHRLGYKNPVKAAGRVHAMMDGNVPLSSKSRAAIGRLPDALEVDKDIVARAVAETDQIAASEARRADDERRAARERGEAEWRAAFAPHAVLHTSRTVPSQITMCGMTGGARRWLMVGLDMSRPPITFVEQALAAIPTMTREGTEGRRGVLFFGEVLGFIINYAPDRAIRFDLGGTPVEVMPQAYRPGEVVLSINGRRVDPAVMARVLGLK